MKFNVRSTRFLDELAKRVASFRGRSVSTVITVPPEMRWWYWVEFGSQGTVIEPVNAKVLRWFDDGGNAVIRQSVNWPGIRPRAFIRKAMPTIKSVFLQAIFTELIEERFRYTEVRRAVRDVGDDVKAII